MRLPITDRFLLQVYNSLEKLETFYTSVTPARTMSEVMTPVGLRLIYLRYRQLKARRAFSQFIAYLKKMGYIRLAGLDKKQGVLLTQKGRRKALRAKWRFQAVPKGKRKDGKWEMIIFDIPERKHFLRDIFREALLHLGYFKLQASVWVCPYDMAQETERVVQEYQLDPYVRVFLIEEVEI